MLGLRHLPLKYRLPLIHSVLNALGKWRAQGWTKAVTSTKSGDFVVSAFFAESLGIGRGGRLSADALRTAGYDFTEHDLRPCFKQILNVGGHLPGKNGVWFIHANAPEVLVALMAHKPDTWADRYRIAYWAWETPKIPASWVFVADYLHEIWVPSRFVHDAVIAGLRAARRDDLIDRVRIMPHPVPVTPIIKQGERFGLKPDICEVLCLFDTKSGAARKNPWAVLEAWQQAFPQDQERARLTLKVSDIRNDPTTEHKLRELIGQRNDIRLVSERLSDADMATFIASFDVLISLHRSEGFGLTLAEAMAAGVSVIATGWSGNMDFMTPENSRLVPVKLIPVHDPDGPYSGLETDPDQIWAEPDVVVAANAICELVGSMSVRLVLAKAGVGAIERLSEAWQKGIIRL
jgi:glycosyltransferase involved in cell wall biosynthesis